jgi:hypothetical protein
MRFQLLVLMLSLSSLAQAQSRGPAVEDFVGIEVETVELHPQGTEALFNFEKEIETFEAAKVEPSFRQPPAHHFVESTPGAWSTSAMMGIIVLLGLPFLTWLLVMNHLRQKATMESASNIEILEKYRKEREARRAAEAEASENRKAS